MATRIKVQPLVQITDPDFQTGFEETQDPDYAICGIPSDIGLFERVCAKLTEVAVESGLPEQQFGAAQVLFSEYWAAAIR
jgi:hypothetical protein